VDFTGLNISGYWNATNRSRISQVAPKSREPSDYQVSILEVAGTSARPEDILAMEGLWQRKLQSKDMGLNRNSASGM
jgi:hypothetical protein